ncbi:MAG: hypothetical protein AAFY84_08400 [Pseudomonadota bacterium]
MTPEDQKARNQRNLAIAGSVVLFIVLVYGVTVLRISAAAG